MKFPKSLKDIKNAGQFDPLAKYNKTLVDPLGLGLGDAIYGKNKGPDYSSFEDQQKDLMNQQNKAYEEFINGGSGDNLKYEDLDPSQLAQLQKSGMESISTDPRLQNAQYDALRQLEEQSKTGFTARDEADLAKLQNDVNRQNAGRVGAIQQNMAARGMSGSGMDLMAQLQSSQDATDREAIAALEKNAQMGERKDAAIMNRGQMSGQMRSQDFNEQAQKAQAQDAINRFNAANSVQAQFQNNQNHNLASQQNWNRGYQFRKDKLGAQTQNTDKQINWSADQQNQKMIRDQQQEDAASGKMGAVMGAAGGVAGGYFGGPQGAVAGSQIGNGVGQGVGRTAYRNNYAHGGFVPGKAPFEGDSPANDMFAAQLSPGEIVIPRSIANDPQASAKFVAAQNAGMDPMASKYMAQDARVKVGDASNLLDKYESAPVLPKNVKAPIRDLGEAPTETVTAQQPINPQVLDALSKTNPKLVEQYRERMALGDKNIADAEKKQGYMQMANVAGKTLTDFNNSQKRDIILKNRVEDFGKRPDILAAKRDVWDDSTLDKLGAQGVASAKEKQARDENRFNQETQLGIMDKANAIEAKMNDPSSQDSQAAREFLKQVAPNAAKMPGFDKLSAAQIQKQAPELYKAYNDAQNREMDKYKTDSSASTSMRGQDIQAGIHGYDVDVRAGTADKDRASRDKNFADGLSSQERRAAVRVTSNGGKAIDEFKKLPVDSQEIIKDLAKKNASKESIANQIDAMLDQADKTNDESQKLAIYRQMGKVLNSTEGADAIGAEEAKRLMAKLQFAYGNFTNDNSTQFGRDLEGFSTDARASANAVREAIKMNQREIDRHYGRTPKQESGSSGGTKAPTKGAMHGGDLP